MLSEDNYIHIDENLAKFYFDESQKKLKDAIDIGSSILTRSTPIIGALSVILTGLMTFGFNNNSNDRLDRIEFICLIGSLYTLSLICYFSYKILFGKKYKPVYYYPYQLMDDAFFGEQYTFKTGHKNDVLKWTYLSLALDMNESIINVNAINEDKFEAFNAVVVYTIGLPLVLSVSYFLFNLFECSHLC